MNRTFLHQLLSEIKNPKKEYRDACAQKIIKHPNLFPLLVNETFSTDDKLSVKSALVLEWICNNYSLEFFLPHLDDFINNLHTLNFDGSKRSCLKICEQIAITYHFNKNHPIQKIITELHIKKIVEISFEWFITPQTIAVKAYSMTTLYHLGFYENWVHSELEKTIAAAINNESKAYKARGKKILKLLRKKK